MKYPLCRTLLLFVCLTSVQIQATPVQTCVGLLSEYSRSLSQTAYALLGEEPTDPQSGLLGRILRLEARRIAREERTVRAHNGGALPYEVPIGAVPSYLLANLPPAPLFELEKALAAQNGEIRICSGNGGYFKQEGRRPILCLAPYSPGTTLSQLAQYFYEWRDAKERLRHTVKTEAQAIDAAFHWIATPQGILSTQLRAKSAELAGLLSDLTEVTSHGDAEDVYVQVVMGDFPHVVRAPFEQAFKLEDFITHNVYPFVEQLKRIARLREIAGMWRWKLTTLPSQRKAFRDQLNEQERRCLEEIGALAVSVQRRLVAQQIQDAHNHRSAKNDEAFENSMKEANRLARLSLLEKVLTTHDLPRELPRQAARLVSRIQKALDIAQMRAVPTSKLTDEEQQEISRVLTRLKNGYWSAEDQWGQPQRRPILREFDHQGASITRQEFRQLDGEGLALWTEEKISGQRIRSYLHSPPNRPSEIRARQEAIRNLLDSGSLVYENLHAVFHSPEFENIRKKFFSAKAAMPNVLADYESDWYARVVRSFREILSESAAAQVGNFVSYQVFRRIDARPLLRSIMDDIQSYFTHIQHIRSAIESSPSRRLQQLKWVLDSCFDEHHPAGIAASLRVVMEDPSYLNKYTAFDKVARSQALQQVAEAYGEIALLFDFAEHAHTSGWRTFPHILEPDSKIGPVLNIQDLHNPRVLRETPEKSVAISVALNAVTGRNLVITGPNGKGKSTVPRSLGAAIIAALNGSPIAASSAELTPLTILFYLQPTDNPADAMSLLMMQGAQIMEQIVKPAFEDRFTIAFMDEILPGTIPEIREDAESELLLYLAQQGGLSVTATHNWGTTALGTGIRTFPASFTSVPSTDTSGLFQNFHVDQYALLPGAATSLADMYEGAIAALRIARWPEAILEKIRQRGAQRIQMQARPGAAPGRGEG